MQEAVAELNPASDKCSRCLQPVPVAAKRCPQCGQPISKARRLIFMSVAAAGVLALLFMLVVMYRVVYLADMQHAPTLEDDQAVPADAMATPPATSQDVPLPPKDDKPSAPPEPEKPPPLNR
jgi:hypothetical protein